MDMTNLMVRATVNGILMPSVCLSVNRELRHFLLFRPLSSLTKCLRLLYQLASQLASQLVVGVVIASIVQNDNDSTIGRDFSATTLAKSSSPQLQRIQSHVRVGGIAQLSRCRYLGVELMHRFWNRKNNKTLNLRMYGNFYCSTRALPNEFSHVEIVPCSSAVPSTLQSISLPPIFIQSKMLYREIDQSFRAPTKQTSETSQDIKRLLGDWQTTSNVIQCRFTYTINQSINPSMDWPWHYRKKSRR